MRMQMTTLSLAIRVVFLAARVDSFSPSAGVSRPSMSKRIYMSVPTPVDTLTSGLASISRIQYGVTVSDEALTRATSPSPNLVALYDVENDAECRKVRERITELDLVVDQIVPAATNSRVFKDAAYKWALPEGTKIPRLVVGESGTNRNIDGADAIIEYLDEFFSSKRGNIENDDGVPKPAGVINDLTLLLASLLRFGRGTTVRDAADVKSSAPRPTKPLILYSYEGNQFCRLVREVLTELDLPYELRSAGKQSPRREELAAITGGSSQCPFLIDQNAEVKMPESADIIRHLYRTYAAWTPPNELLQTTSKIITPLLKPIYKVIAPIQAGSDRDSYETELSAATREIEMEIGSSPVVIYTYSLSPFCTEATALLENIGVKYKEISLGKEWIPGLIAEGAALKRAALGKMTGQTSLPHVFVNGKSIGGLFSGNPGLLPSVERGDFLSLVKSV